MDYTRRTYDKAYRRVPLYNSGTPHFTDFTSDGQRIQYNDRDQILEVLRDDGKTELFCGNRERIVVSYSRHGTDHIRIQIRGQSQNLGKITARMWARKGSSSLRYKVPPMPKCEGNCAYILIPGGNADVELFGDKYFEQAFELSAQ